jgi:hypothetical protein
VDRPTHEIVQLSFSKLDLMIIIRRILNHRIRIHILLQPYSLHLTQPRPLTLLLIRPTLADAATEEFFEGFEGFFEGFEGFFEVFEGFFEMFEGFFEVFEGHGRGFGL